MTPFSQTSLLQQSFDRANVKQVSLSNALLEYLCEHNARLSDTDLLREDPLQYLHEKDFFNDILNFARHIVPIEDLKANKLI